MQFGQELSKEALSPELVKRFDELTKKDKVVLFMKGNKEFPQCGFSDTVVKVLKFYGAEFQTYDVLSDDNIRSGMKMYSEWATFPQLYIGGEFIGGCDIIMDMHQNGEIEKLLEA
jgi:monothiol glutaredoxin